MRESEWQILIEDLETYYERKRASQETKDLWYTTGGIQQIPNEVGRWAYKKITDTYEMFPRNLPMVIRAMWMDWQRANPHRVDKHHFQCRNANCDRGWLWLFGKDVDREAEDAGVPTTNPYAMHPHVYVCPCGDCNTVNGRGSLTMREAEEMGFWAWSREEADEIRAALPKYDRSKWARSEFREAYLPEGSDAGFVDISVDGAKIIQNATGVGEMNKDRGRGDEIDPGLSETYLNTQGEADHGVVFTNQESGSANYTDSEPPIDAYDADAEAYGACWDGDEVF